MARSATLVALIAVVVLLPATVRGQQGTPPESLKTVVRAFLPANWVADALARPPVKVYLDDAGSDVVGVQLAHQLRQAFRRAAEFSLVTNKKQAAVVVTMTTTDPFASADGGHQALAIASFAFVANNGPFNSLLYYGAVTTAADTTALQARKLVAQLDDTLHSYK